ACADDDAIARTPARAVGRFGGVSPARHHRPAAGARAIARERFVRGCGITVAPDLVAGTADSLARIAAAIAGRPRTPGNRLVGWRPRATRLLRRANRARAARVDFLRTGRARPVDAARMVCVNAPAYAELHCLSDFSFGRGASSARELFARARQCGYSALAITDECSLAGIVRAWEAARDTDMQLIVGAEMQLQGGPKLVLLCEDKAGYITLCKLISKGRRASRKGEYRLMRGDFQDGAPG